MKKFFCSLLAGMLMISFAACSSSSGTSSESKNSSMQKNPESSSQVISESQPESSKESEPQSDYYFKDNVLLAEDVKIEITDWKIIPVGETGNEYGSAPVIAFWFKTTNLSGKEHISPLTSWMAMFTAIQDNDPNAINKLNVGTLPDNAYLETQMAEIKKDGTVECAIAYELDDTVTPVLLKATKGLLGDDLGEQTFNIAE